ncbi:uncharacterized protein EI97DRAFT_455050 [Westerdykella ornata]|uniref:Uncharacterized protein n=1 Tax=Westerdykella ornata TaxID=318751 RepID=A0A6A6JWL1_WESOR|nr:uncharacterized protein EI97DRAFT_455050 [Westerdykella ornata]KAF2280126.1 hypothetical protein EI97DRAFT_455050 [Westerdykella ornata]
MYILTLDDPLQTTLRDHDLVLENFFLYMQRYAPVKPVKPVKADYCSPALLSMANLWRLHRRTVPYLTHVLADERKEEGLDMSLPWFWGPSPNIVKNPHLNQARLEAVETVRGHIETMRLGFPTQSMLEYVLLPAAVCAEMRQAEEAEGKGYGQGPDEIVILPKDLFWGAHILMVLARHMRWDEGRFRRYFLNKGNPYDDRTVFGENEAKRLSDALLEREKWVTRRFARAWNRIEDEKEG